MQHKTAYMDVLSFSLLFLMSRDFEAEISLPSRESYIKKKLLYDVEGAVSQSYRKVPPNRGQS